ncbi:uncharacterized protein PV06_07386 [Exophiala oligosperma]|uniref:UBC core domain-containing protein n=1 Tax=Exophiala oligosperma TaxID=215243 RepID=A0A0D2AJ41_9EURO|nr:uncharacterized protein PV06_07386 [Exophiala oligosperma]KIW40161.1 hypothetical protein PV06_07386 [Exophiala oligosperma]
MAPSPTMRRLLKETAELSSPSSNPNPAFYAAPVSDADLHEWHFTLLGPPSPSPYEGGMYHGRITLPPTYPLKPPNFRFLTPSGRFEVNREICLSISGFHEETWMPAWGVRTALTALRSFMAEKGTAGQVGGLEASVDVRKRLARESRGWRCEACRKSNEAIMREWWEVCRQSGVNVQEEEGVRLESLPEGMNLETRSPEDKKKSSTAAASGQQESQLASESKDNGKAKAESTGDDATSNARQTQMPTSPSIRTPPAHAEPEFSTSANTRTSVDSLAQTQNTSTVRQSQQSRPDKSNDDTTNLHPPPASPPPPRMIPTPSAEAAQASAEAVLTPSDFSSPSSSSSSSRLHRPSISLMSGGIHAPPLAAANAALQNSNMGAAAPLILQRDRARESITIDRAIAGIFVALCLMVLKKIFYPAGTNGGGMGFGGGVDDFYLQRE